MLAYLLLIIALTVFFYTLFNLLIRPRVAERRVFNRGEALVQRALATLNETNYKVLHDLMVARTDVHTSQIDHVVVSTSRKVFVIETKDYGGWITGEENDVYWRQTLPGRKIPFMKPLHQNYGHVQALKECLTEFSDFEYVPIVAFIPRSTLKVNVGAQTEVTSTDALVETILKHTGETVPSERVEQFTAKLQNLEHCRPGCAQGPRGDGSRAEATEENEGRKRDLPQVWRSLGREGGGAWGIQRVFELPEM